MSDQNGEQRPLFDELREKHKKLRKSVEMLETEFRLVKDKYLTLSGYRGNLSQEFTMLDAQVSSLESSALIMEFLRLEDQVSDMANLLVVIQQLHSSLDRGVILASIHDIVLNIIGAEEMALYETQPNSSMLLLTSSQGLEGKELSPVTIGKGIIGKTVETGERFVRGQSEIVEELPEEHTLTACVALRCEEQIAGAIATFRLLNHKSGLTPLDNDVLDLLSTHAAMALHCAHLAELTARAS